MSESFSTRIKNFILRHHLLTEDDRVVVGLSGGADSVALLDVLHQLRYKCVAAHCNFHLRGDESMRDESFCRELCIRLGIQLLTIDFDVEAQRNLTGESVEMACRTLRYDWWRKLLSEGVGTIIAVGHHREDNIETFFLNLFRGSGLTGLKGMLPKTSDVIRPLLDVSRQDITAYLSERGIEYVTDSTNLLNDYKRNLLRNRILPKLELSFPGALDGIVNSVSYLRDNYGLYTDHIDELKSKYKEQNGTINLNQLLATEKNARMVLFELLSMDGINMSQVDNILSSMTDKEILRTSGRTFKGVKKGYLLNRGKLIPVCEIDNRSDIKNADIFSSPFSTKRIKTDDFIEMRKKRCLKKDAIYLDSRILDGNPRFELRGWNKGDRMIPFGMKHGSRLVSDILSDAKYSLIEKREVRLLTRNDEILWVIGLRTTERFRVTPETCEVIEISYHNDDDIN